ncbi:cysQ protein [Vibrio cholerae]|nr:cysQ protein [Vibrio cholerae]
MAQSLKIQTHKHELPSSSIAIGREMNGITHPRADLVD